MNPDLNGATPEELKTLAGTEDKEPRKSQADMLVKIAEPFEFFHADVDEPFVSVPVGEAIDTYNVNSKDFKRRLSHEFWNRYKKAPNARAMQDAVNVLAARAIYDGNWIPVHTRVANDSDKIYLDLGDATLRVVAITADGWTILKRAPVKFVRRRGMLAIPEPVRGGLLDELRPFINNA